MPHQMVGCILQLSLLSLALITGLCVLVKRRRSNLDTNLATIKGTRVLIFGPFSQQTIALAQHFSSLGYDLTTYGHCGELKKAGVRADAISIDGFDSLQVIFTKLKPAVVIHGPAMSSLAAEIDHIARATIDAEFEDMKRFFQVLHAAQTQFRAQKSGLFLQIIEDNDVQTPLKVFKGAKTAFQLSVLRAASGEGIAFGAHYHAFVFPYVQAKSEDEAQEKLSQRCARLMASSWNNVVVGAPLRCQALIPSEALKLNLSWAAAATRQ